MHQLAQCFRIDLRAWRVFRHILGCLICVDAICRAAAFPAHYAGSGMLPVHDVCMSISSSDGNGYLRWSIMLLSSSDVWQSICLSAYGIGGLLLMFCHRYVLPVSVFVWILQVSVITRAPTLCNGGDTLQKLLLFWNMLIAWQFWARGSVAEQRPLSGITAAGILMQMCMLCWFTAILKSHPIWRSDCTAVEAALKLSYIQTSFGRWLADYHALNKVGTVGTLLLEEYGPFLALAPNRFWRVRSIIVVAFVCFHLLHLATLRIGFFPFVCVAGWILFLPQQAWDRFWPQRALSQNADHIDAVTRIRHGRPFLERTVSGIAFVSLGYVLCWNVRSLNPEACDTWFTANVRAPGVVMGLHQRWSMFAPRPSPHDGWMLAVASLESGQIVDLLTEQPPAWTEREDKVASHYPSWRWRKHLVYLSQKDDKKLTENLHSYLVRNWNERHVDQVTEMSLIFRYRDRDRPNDGILQAEIYPEWRPADPPAPSDPAQRTLSETPDEV